jgi:DNA ligase 1
MLGSPVRSLEEVYERLEGRPFAAEFKYDGQRAQIHALKSEENGMRVKIFSRHLEDMTGKVSL